MTGIVSPTDRAGVYVPTRVWILFLLRQPWRPAIRAEGSDEHYDGAVCQPLLVVLLAQRHPAHHWWLPHGQVCPVFKMHLYFYINVFIVLYCIYLYISPSSFGRPNYLPV